MRPLERLARAINVANRLLRTLLRFKMLSPCLCRCKDEWERNKDTARRNFFANCFLETIAHSLSLLIVVGYCLLGSTDKAERGSMRLLCRGKGT